MSLGFFMCHNYQSIIYQRSVLYTNKNVPWFQKSIGEISQTNWSEIELGAKQVSNPPSHNMVGCKGESRYLDGFMVLWFYGCMVWWFDGFLVVVLWLYGFVVYGCVVLWFYSFVVLWLYILWLYGVVVSWFQQITKFPFRIFWKRLIPYAWFSR